jgi:hypothetical protein
MKTSFLISTLFVGSLALGGRLAAAQEIDSEPATAEASEQDSAQSAGIGAAPKSRSPKKLPPPEGARRLSPDYDVWVDPKEGVVIVDGQVSLREGMLEMLACTRNTKEHEAIVSANTKAYLVHAGLVAIGATPGHPVQFVPEYKPPAGTEIEVLVQWIDDDGDEQTLRAQEWIKDISTNKEMTHPWVFGGSRFWTDPETGKKYYQAEGGDFICVSNFGTAMLDIPIQSSTENNELAFQTFTERIPPLGTPVRLILKPKLKEQGAGNKEQGGEKSEASARKSSTAAPAVDDPHAK